MECMPLQGVTLSISMMMRCVGPTQFGVIMEEAGAAQVMTKLLMRWADTEGRGTRHLCTLCSTPICGLPHILLPNVGSCNRVFLVFDSQRDLNRQSVRHRLGI